MSVRHWLACLAVCGCLAPAWAETARWDLPARKAVILPVSLGPIPEGPVRAILVSLEEADAQGQADAEPAATPLMRNRERLAAQGVQLLVPGAPSDHPQGIRPAWRRGSAHLMDMQALVAAARIRYPGVPLFVEAYRSDADTLLGLAENHTAGVAGYILISGYLAAHRDDPLAGLGVRGLVVQPLGAYCAAMPLPEARAVAEAAQWAFVSVGDAVADVRPGCGPQSHVGLAGHDEALVALLQDWMAGRDVPSAIGNDPAARAYTEQVFMIPGAMHWLTGRTRIELTLLTPPGQGPFPLVLYSHGDIRDSSAYITRHKRYRDMKVADAFLALGYAVAFPARPGVGHSAGSYTHYDGAGGIYLGPATGLLVKGREQMAEALAALGFLRTRPEVDASRVIVAGQSAGGFAASCLAAQTPVPEWLRGVVNFSGGRGDGSHGGHNAGMISAFAYLGRTSRVPQMWIFAAGDSHYPIETIQDSHAAFTAAGGVAELHIYPRPGKLDGHFIYHQPAAWRQDLQAFLAAHALLPAGSDCVRKGCR